MREISNNQKLILGKQGENRAVVIRFEIESWRQEFGEGYLRARHKRRIDDIPYPVELVIDGNYALWVVNEVDNAAAGKGELELVYIGSDGIVAKSMTLDTYTYPSNEDIGDVPDAYEDWLVRLEVLAHEATLSVMEFMEANKEILRGEPGFSGIHYGEEPPTDERVNAWVIPSGEPDVPVTQDMVESIVATLVEKNVAPMIDDKVSAHAQDTSIHPTDEHINSLIDQKAVSDEHINYLIDEKLGVIENGSY